MRSSFLKPNRLLSVAYSEVSDDGGMPKEVYQNGAWMSPVSGACAFSNLYILTERPIFRHDDDDDDDVQGLILFGHYFKHKQSQRPTADQKTNTFSTPPFASTWTTATYFRQTFCKVATVRSSDRSTQVHGSIVRRILSSGAVTLQLELPNPGSTWILL